MTLTVAPVAYAAARYAVETWHYSRKMPNARNVLLGVWEDDRYIGVVIFGRGASPDLGRQYQLTQMQVCELTRVALTTHRAPVSQIVAAALDVLHRTSPGLRLVVSFADPERGHHGGIYQAGNWVYTGCGQTHAYVVHGERVHPKTLYMRHGVGGQSIPWLREHVDPNAERVVLPGKHRYLYPLDRAMRRRVTKLAQPYPPRGQGVDGDTPGSQPGDAGFNPRGPLHV